MTWLEAQLGRLVAFLPALLSGLLILAIGWVVARLLERGTVALSSRARLDEFLSKQGIVEKPAGRSPEGRVASRAAGKIVFYVVMLVAVMQATRAWGLDAIAVGLMSVLAYLPHVLAAALIFGAALVTGNWVRSRMRRAAMPEAGVTPATRNLASGAVRAAILAFGAFLALRELQIAADIVTIAFTLTLGTIALATALAFGLGSRETVAKLTDDWYRQSARPSFGAETRPRSSAGLAAKSEERPSEPH